MVNLKKGLATCSIKDVIVMVFLLKINFTKLWKFLFFESGFFLAGNLTTFFLLATIDEENWKYSIVDYDLPGNATYNFNVQ